MFKQFYVKYQMTSSLLLCKTIIELYANNKLNITRANSLQILSLTKYKISLSKGRYSVYFNYMIIFYRNVLIVLYKLDTQTFLLCSFLCYTRYIFEWLDRFKFKKPYCGCQCRIRCSDQQNVFISPEGFSIINGLTVL